MGGVHPVAKLLQWLESCVIPAVDNVCCLVGRGLDADQGPLPWL